MIEQEMKKKRALVVGSSVTKPRKHRKLEHCQINDSLFVIIPIEVLQYIFDMLYVSVWQFKFDKTYPNTGTLLYRYKIALKFLYNLRLVCKQFNVCHKYINTRIFIDDAIKISTVSSFPYDFTYVKTLHINKCNLNIGDFNVVATKCPNLEWIILTDSRFDSDIEERGWYEYCTTINNLPRKIRFNINDVNELYQGTDRKLFCCNVHKLIDMYIKIHEDVFDEDSQTYVFNLDGIHAARCNSCKRSCVGLHNVNCSRLGTELTILNLDVSNIRAGSQVTWISPVNKSVIEHFEYIVIDLRTDKKWDWFTSFAVDCYLDILLKEFTNTDIDRSNDLYLLQLKDMKWETITPTKTTSDTSGSSSENLLDKYTVEHKRQTLPRSCRKLKIYTYSLVILKSIRFITISTLTILDIVYDLQYITEDSRHVETILNEIFERLPSNIISFRFRLTEISSGYRMRYGSSLNDLCALKAKFEHKIGLTYLYIGSKLTHYCPFPSLWANAYYSNKYTVDEYKNSLRADIYDIVSSLASLNIYYMNVQNLIFKIHDKIYINIGYDLHDITPNSNCHIGTYSSKLFDLCCNYQNSKFGRMTDAVVKITNQYENNFKFNSI